MRRASFLADPPIVPANDCVAVVVETNVYSFAESHRLIEVARRVVVVND